MHYLQVKQKCNMWTINKNVRLHYIISIYNQFRWIQCKILQQMWFLVFSWGLQTHESSQGLHPPAVPKCFPHRVENTTLPGSASPPICTHTVTSNSSLRQILLTHITTTMILPSPVSLSVVMAISKTRSTST